MNSKLIAYAVDVVSFLLQKTSHERIKKIILFGSAARDEVSKESDIDLFIDVMQEDKQLEKELNKNREDFFSSTKYKHYWKPLGISHDIHLSIGKLDEWKELKPSIIAEGIVLYGKYSPESIEGKHKSFFIWENIKPNSKRVLFNKQIFGYKAGKKFYKGLLQKYSGERLGKGCVMAPLEHSMPFQKLLKKYRINVKIKKVMEYS